AAGAERPQPFEQRGHLPQLRRGGDGAFFLGVPLFLNVEDNLGIAGLSETDLIAVRQLALRHPFAVDERAEARLLVPDDAAVGRIEHDLVVNARDIRARQAQIRLAAAADREERLVDGDNAPSERVGDDEAWSRPG